MIRKTTWILLGIFLILLVVLFFLQRSGFQGEAETAPTEAVAFLFDLQGKSITGLRVTDGTGKVVEVQKIAGSIWTLLEPVGEQADTGRIESAIEQAGSLRVLATLETALELDTIGLNPAAYQITITLDNEQQQTAFVGNLTATQSGYYAFLLGQPEVVVDKINIDGLLELLTNPPIMRTPTPPPAADMTPTIQP